MWYRIARAAAAAVILAALIHFDLLDLSGLTVLLHTPGLLLLAAVLLAITVLVAALRWWILTLRLGFPMSLTWSLRTTLVCQFLNTFLPGAYGSDVVRIGLVYRVTRSRLSRATVTVLVDRLTGLLALVFLGVAVLPLLPNRYSGAMYLPLVAISVAIVGGTAVGLLFGERIAELVELIPLRIARRLAHAVREIHGALHEYIGRWDALVVAFGLSVVQFAVVVVALMVLGQAMGFDALSASGYAIAGVLAIVANAIPLTPGGLGIGEAAFAQVAVLLEAVHSGAGYASVFLTMRVLTVLISVCGIIPYLALKGEVSEGIAMVATTPSGRSGEG